MRRLFDKLQLWLYRHEMHDLASYVETFGSPDKKPTLRAFDYDPTINWLNGIDEADIARPTGRESIN